MQKIAIFLVSTLLIATAVLPVVGTMNVVDKNEINNENLCSLNNHDIEIEWERLYGGSDTDVFRSAKQTNDGGFIMVGVKDGQSHWLLKVDSNGDEEWSSTVRPNPELYPRCYTVEQTSDGGYITAGCNQDTAGIGYDRCIWKVDENGNTEWLKIYDDPLYGWHYCIQETSDGGYIIGGEIDIDVANWDVLLMKIDSDGNIEWQKIWSYGEFGDKAFAVRETPDGGYILSGRKGNTRGEADFLIIKTDSNGNKEWDKTYGGNRMERTQSNDILCTSDGGYIFLAETRSFGAGYYDLWIIRTDSQGNMIWNRTIGGENTEFNGGMDFTDDGRIIISASYDVGYSMAPRSEGLVIKITEDGIIEWQKTFGYERDDQLQGVCSTNDGGYIVAGNMDSSSTEGAGLWDAWLIKIKPFENYPPEKPDQPSGDKRGLPDTEYTFSSNAVTDPEGDIVYYLWDWGDGNYSDLLDTTEATYTWSYEDNFEIRVMAIDEHGGESDWSDPLPFSTPKNKSLNIQILDRLLTRFPILKFLI